MFDSDDKLGTVNAMLTQLDGAGSISFCESVIPQGVLSFSITWEEGEAVEKKAKSPKKGKKEEETPRAEASLDDGTTQQL